MPNEDLHILLNYMEFFRFREYGLWDRYAAIYPKEDLTFTANHDSYQKNWFFAHVTRYKIQTFTLCQTQIVMCYCKLFNEVSVYRKASDNTFKATTWRIFFNLENVSSNAVYKLWIAVAAATYSELQVSNYIICIL